MSDWPWKNFSVAEMQCRETGECNMQASFMDRLQALRIEFGQPLIISSGFRSCRHSAERHKKLPGTHAVGCAVDIAISGADALRLIELAIMNGFTGIGISQSGAHSARFIHLDDASAQPGRPRPHIWSY